MGRALQAQLVAFRYPSVGLTKALTSEALIHPLGEHSKNFCCRAAQVSRLNETSNNALLAFGKSSLELRNQFFVRRHAHILSRTVRTVKR